MKLTWILVIVAIFSGNVSLVGADDIPALSDKNIFLRGSLNNARLQFEQKKTGHVAFIGGSITQMNGYRPMVANLLAERFPETRFTFTAAGISSTCSTTGAFRLATDVLAKGPVDLFFIEFAVNDDQDAGHGSQQCIRGMEGIIRQVRSHNPAADMVITHFVNPGMLKQLHKGETPLTMAAHDRVARHYQVSTIHLAREIADLTLASKISWQQYGGTHPKPFGNSICTAMIDQLLDNAWASPNPAPKKKQPHPTVQTLLDPHSFTHGHFLRPDQAKIRSGWKWEIPAWQKLPGSKRAQFTNIPMLQTSTPGSELVLSFKGRAIGAYIVAGPDAGIVEAHVDDQPSQKVDLFHRFSRGLHYPRTVMFAQDLKAGSHTLTLKMTADRNPGSAGTAMRIMHFTVNGSP
ncbi:MAG TPA: SGNH/GDSL hydrolase family protein [Planctomycetes bacterium]|nr:SGNH/GDSL hydrolase family protein [Planctomycetaceae bacterium]HIN94727.1 SGNH/GDSL hydrolase family protein [Planctomycetota bacterium]